jgi:hypothetical protein
MDNQISYTAFCIAALLLRQNSQMYNNLDLVFTDVNKLEIDFNNSTFNDPNRSLLDCINEYFETL